MNSLKCPLNVPCKILKDGSRLVMAYDIHKDKVQLVCDTLDGNNQTRSQVFISGDMAKAIKELLDE